MAAPRAATEPQGASAANEDLRPIQTKLVLLGEAAVGKTSIVHRFVQDEFQENREPTIGAAFLTDRLIKFEIWDTAGQERFHSLAPMYYRNAQASAVVYDVTKASSFDKAKSWVKELQRQANPNIVIALVGNKLDLITASQGASNGYETDEEEEADDGEPPAALSVDREVARAEAQQYADDAGLLFFETSAKTGEGVLETFTEIAKHIPFDKAPTGPSAQGPTRDELVNVAHRSQAAMSDGCNC